MSAFDRVLKSLERESRAVPQEAFRVVNEQIAGNFVEDAYLYTGFIQINQLQRRTGPLLYSVFYAPSGGPGGIMRDRRFEGSDKLRDFLRNSLHINQGTVESVLHNLDQCGSATVPNVELKSKDLRRLELA